MATIDEYGGAGVSLSGVPLGGPSGWAEAVYNYLLDLRGDLDALPTSGGVATNAQAGTSYTLVLTDAGKLVELGNAAAITLTVPTNASVAFPVGTRIDLLQTGAGQVTVAGAGGVTINAKTGMNLSGQWAGATLIKRATDTWVLIGALAA